MSQIIQPADIEAESFAIITRLLGDYPLDEENAPVILRAIHTTADLDYAKTLFFSPGAVAKGVKALAAGAHIVTDTHMAEAGINKRRLEQLGGRVHCFISDEDVAAQAKSRGITRAVVAMEKAAALDAPCIFAIGNAPTALLALCDLIRQGRVDPALVIGVPVGFVNVVESKERLRQEPVPQIVAMAARAAAIWPLPSATPCCIGWDDKDFCVIGRKTP